MCNVNSSFTLVFYKSVHILNVIEILKLKPTFLTMCVQNVYDHLPVSDTFPYSFPSVSPKIPPVLLHNVYCIYYTKCIVSMLPIYHYFKIVLFIFEHRVFEPYGIVLFQEHEFRPSPIETLIRTNRPTQQTSVRYSCVCVGFFTLCVLTCCQCTLRHIQ